MASFYNTYRPHQFADVIGQDKVVSILKRQAMTGQFAHSYLLFGQSGTGKTSVARIMAMGMSCTHIKDGTGEPCGECQSCRAIAEGKDWDVLEIDGGRFRGLEDIKDLAYKAYFSPIGKKKIYIIDECHQLTDPAWNGLLKLLEEPPPHLVIILVTTDFSRIPETIVSRCQLYPFSKLKSEHIKSKLKIIVESEGVDIDDKGLEFVAQCSGGNCRIAENQLEQQCVLAK